MLTGGAVHDDGWAILGLPPGRRDLGSHELWERSLIRSKRRREREAARRANVPTARKVGFALAATAVLAPVAQTASAQSTATSASVDGMLRKGDRGPAVASVQRGLGIQADGVFGPQTKRAVKRFQARNGLEVDGVVGPITRGALNGGANTNTTTSNGPKPSRSVTIAVQGKLGIPADGVFGPQTRRAVRAFQARNGLEVDGPGASHVGIATSNSTVISATTHGVREHEIGGSYWGSHYIGARRV